MRHDELMKDLANHLSRNSDRMVWCDLRMGTVHSQRPDVYTINKSYSNPKPLAYECKVSVGDFRSDVTKGKWHGYLDHACAVIFCAPEGIIKREDLPKTCGLMVRGENGWRTVKGPTLSPVKLNQELLLKLLIDGVNAEHSQKVHERILNTYEVESKLRKKFGDDVSICIRDLGLARRKLEGIQKDIKRQTDIAQASADEIIARAKINAVRDRFELNRQLEELKNVLKLPQNSGMWAIESAIDNIRKMQNENEVMSSCIKMIDSIEKEIERARKVFA